MDQVIEAAFELVKQELKRKVIVENNDMVPEI